ncbi:MAG: D-amino acid aminotransferase [Rhodospirillaceae bacterium]|nr:D-amino acid aminotransferase [Rhodospirillaceae bacterium]|tara:strand:- start:12486 stop:13349 length:864 start_codon:yes stop_codon:yes gene_type:complete
MSEFSYVNGLYVRSSDASVNVEDRGYQFADGVYEVISVYQAHLVDRDLHFDRLNRSLTELDIPWPCERRVLGVILAKLLKRNGLNNGSVYIQITRGVASRKHAFPTEQTRSSLVITCNRKGIPSSQDLENGVSVVTVKENRWGRRDIKSVSLLPNVMAKQYAVENGAFESWFVDDQLTITEGSSTNAWIVLKGGELVTRPTGTDILSGITRLKLIELAQAKNFHVTERPFTVKEALEAEEAFLTSTTSFVMPVVEIDGKRIGSGIPGPVSEALLQRYREHIIHSAEA